MPILDQESFMKAQSKLESVDDLKPYMGKWVAIRDGKVISSALSARELRNQDEVRPTDAIVPVPRTSAGYFIA